MKKCMLASLVALSLSYNAAAKSEAGTIKTESGFVVTPLLELGLKYNDNIYSKSEDTIGSSILTVDPSVNFELKDGANTYSIDLGALTGFYDEDSTDNFVDGFLGLSANLEQSEKSRLALSVDANWTTEPRGSGLSEGSGDAIDKPIRYADQTLEANYEYGAKSAFGRLALNAKYYNKEYLNFKEQTQYRDLDQLLFGTKFIYNTQAGSDAFIELTHEDINYDVTPAGELDKSSKDVRALVGLKWKATALTSGSVKLGYQEKDFDDAERENFDGVSWEANVRWKPLTYSSLRFKTSQAAVDSLTEGDYIEELKYALSWKHEWNEYLASNLGVKFKNEEYVGVVREDETTTFEASIDYQILRWVGVSVFAELKDKESTKANLEHDKNVYGVNFNLSM